MGLKQYFTAHIPTATLATNQVIGPLPFTGRILSVSCRARALANSGGNAVLDIVLCASGTAVASGTSALASTIKLETTKATQTLTSDATAPDEDDTVSIGPAVYTFKDTLTVPAVPYEVLIGVSAATALDNLKSAINASAGAGTTYGTGTVANTVVTATTNTDTTQVVEAILPGTGGNSIALAEVSDHLSWGAAHPTGGLGFAADTNFTASLGPNQTFGAGRSIGLKFSGTLTSLADLDVFITTQ